MLSRYFWNSVYESYILIMIIIDLLYFHFQIYRSLHTYFIQHHLLGESFCFKHS